MYREASGTSGMTAAMNGSLNLSLPDGWVPEFAVDEHNAFVVSPAADELSGEEKDTLEALGLLDKLEKVIIPLYYTDQQKWLKMVKTAAQEIVPTFDSGRMVKEYEQILY